MEPIGNTSQQNKDHVTSPQLMSYLMAKKLKAFLLRSGIRQECPVLPFIFNIVLEVLATEIKEEKRNSNRKIIKTVIVCR